MCMCVEGHRCVEGGAGSQGLPRHPGHSSELGRWPHIRAGSHLRLGLRPRRTGVGSLANIPRVPIPSGPPQDPAGPASWELRLHPAASLEPMVSPKHPRLPRNAPWGPGEHSGCSEGCQLHAGLTRAPWHCHPQAWGHPRGWEQPMKSSQGRGFWRDRGALVSLGLGTLGGTQRGQHFWGSPCRGPCSASPRARQDGARGLEAWMSQAG